MPRLANHPSRVVSLYLSKYVTQRASPLLKSHSDDCLAFAAAKLEALPWDVVHVAEASLSCGKAGSELLLCKIAGSDEEDSASGLEEGSDSSGEQAGRVRLAFFLRAQCDCIECLSLQVSSCGKCAECETYALIGDEVPCLPLHAFVDHVEGFERDAFELVMLANVLAQLYARFGVVDAREQARRVALK